MPVQELDLDQRGYPRSRSLGGRPTRYTTPRVLAIVGALFDGASRADAARRAGISPSTFYAWLQLGRQGHPTFKPLAEAVKKVRPSRGFGVAFGRRGFWNPLR